MTISKRIMAGIPASSIMMLQTTILRQMSKPIFSVKEFQKNIVQIQLCRWDFSWIIREFLLLMSFFPEIPMTVWPTDLTLDASKSSLILAESFPLLTKEWQQVITSGTRSTRPLMTDMFSVCPSGAQKKASRTMFWNRKVMNGLVQNTSGNPANLQEQSKYPLFRAKK